jgi:hypothetical protein
MEVAKAAEAAEEAVFLFAFFLEILDFWANFGFFGKFWIFVTYTDIFSRRRNIGGTYGYKNRYLT